MPTKRITHVSHVLEPIYIPRALNGNLHHLSVTMSGVTQFIPQANAGTGVNPILHRKNSREVLEELQVNGSEE